MNEYILPTAKGLDPESPGIILYDVNTTKQTILFTMASVDGAAPKLGDKVAFHSLLLDFSCIVILPSNLRGDIKPDLSWQ